MRLEARFTRLVECYIKAFARTEPEKKDKQAAWNFYFKKEFQKSDLKGKIRVTGPNGDSIN